jgi:CheY-like chemotaxis protein
MRILVAEDDPVPCRVLRTTLEKWGFEVAVATDGAAAWKALEAPDAPRLAILDWMMPEMDGVAICRRARARTAAPPVYLILLTARGRREDVVAGLEAGADDYLTKPFNKDELRARLRVGERIVGLWDELAGRVRELEEALGRVRRLSGLLPICSYCKKVRDDRNYWNQVEAYVTEHSEARFSHSICPECFETHVRPEVEKTARGARRR